MMDSKHLKHFVSVAEFGHFTQAAAALHIAQPALSISIKKFEQQLGMTLFRRNERKVELTDEGKVLYQHAKRVLQQIDDAMLAMDELKGLEKGEVRLGAPSMMGSYYFPKILIAFKRRYPNLKLTLVEAGISTIRTMLLNGELDIGVINQDAALSDDLETDHLLRSEMVAVVGKNHPFATKTTVTFSEFFAQELVMFKDGYFHRDYLEKQAKQQQLEFDCSFETNLLPLILNIVRHDVAITSLLQLVTQHESDIVGIPFAQPVKMDLALAWRKGGYLSIAERTFIEFIKAFDQK